MSKLITRRSVMPAGAAGAVGTLTTAASSMVRLAFGERATTSPSPIFPTPIFSRSRARLRSQLGPGSAARVLKPIWSAGIRFRDFRRRLAQLGKKDELTTRRRDSLPSISKAP